MGKIWFLEPCSSSLMSDMHLDELPSKGYSIILEINILQQLATSYP